MCVMSHSTTTNVSKTQTFQMLLLVYARTESILKLASQMTYQPDVQLYIRLPCIDMVETLMVRTRGEKQSCEMLQIVPG